MYIAWSTDIGLRSGGFPVHGVHVRVVGVRRVQHSLTKLASVGDGVAQVLGFYVVLQRGQSRAGLVQSANFALIVASSQLVNPIPDQVPQVLCKKDSIRLTV